MNQSIAFELNGDGVRAEAESGQLLLFLLRDTFGLQGAKRGCDYGGCGACTVLVNGSAVYSCMYPAMRADGKTVLTIEGLSPGNELHPLQKAFHEHWAVQCGFCSAGMIMAAKAFLDRHPDPDEREIREALVGNLCVCTGYVKIVEAVQEAVRVIGAVAAGHRGAAPA
jgi:carbon-monoxide dehydrogenase small subunit